MKILAVEDDPTLLLVLSRTLRKLGHDVVEAGSGRAAWEAVATTHVRVVVSDWMMPDMDGLDLCRRIRAREFDDYVYFIILTVKDASPENKQKAADAGVDDFLVKPLHPIDLELRLRVAERVIASTTRIRQLEGLLPICTYCRKVRDDHDYWQQFESYLHQHTNMKLSHSFCPECYEKVVVPQLKAAGIPPVQYPPRRPAGDAAESIP